MPNFIRVTLLLLLAALCRDVAIAQSALGVVAGRIFDAATGESIGGVRVNLVVRPGPEVPRPLVTTTNGDGAFVLAGVPAGRWRLHVEKAGFYLVTGTESGPLMIDTGAKVNVDLRMDRGGAIAGRVVDAKRKPLGGVSVSALVRGRPLIFGYTDTVSTDDLGEFRLAGLPPGEYTVSARTFPGPPNAPVLPTSSVFVETYYPGVAGVDRAASVVVVRGATTSSIDLQMRTAAAYQVSGLAVDASGRPAPGAMVQLSPVRGSIATRFTGTARTDGTFRIDNVPEGIYRLQAAMPVVTRSATGSSSSVRFPGTAVQDVVIQGGDVTGVRVMVAMR